MPSLVTCQICQKDFKQISQTHLNFHNILYEEYIKKFPDSPVICDEILEKRKNGYLKSKEIILIYHENKWNNFKLEYTNNPKLCILCNNSISYRHRENKFCSGRCSAIYSNNNRNHSTESRIKQSNTLKEYFKLNPREKIIKIKICEYCRQPHNRKTKTCSKECFRKLISLSIRKAFEEGRHKGNEYRARNHQSYLEKSFEEWLLKTSSIEYIKEYPIKRYNKDNSYKCSYYIDFYFPSINLAIELDGTHHKNQKDYDEDRDLYIKEKTGIKILRISHKEYTSKTRIDEITKLLSH